MTGHIIVINSGSSSIKFAIFSNKGFSIIYNVLIDDLFNNPSMKIKSSDKEIVFESNLKEKGHHFAILELIKWLEQKSDEISVVAIGHRVVHGGRKFQQPVLIDENVIKELKEIIPLAPLHQPHNIEAIEVFAKEYKNIPQVACFDTAFHSTQDNLIKSFALPEKYFNNDVIRYGFHGLSYEYITSTLIDGSLDFADGKVIIAHLGNGSSMCAINNRISKATTMGLTPLDGLMMGTRAGNIDPGVILYLVQEEGMELNQINRLLYKESGLKGVSGLTNDMRELLSSSDNKAKYAVDMFCMIAARNLVGMIPVIDGLEAIVFTAGVGENSPVIREKICQHLSWLGVQIDSERNSNNELYISSDISKIKVCVIPTNEELMIAKHSRDVIS